MATHWTEVGLKLNPPVSLNPDDPNQGLLGSNAILGNTWMEDTLLSMGADNLIKKHFPHAVPEQPEILKGATGLFDSLGKKRVKVFQDQDSEGGTPPGGDPFGGRGAITNALGIDLFNPINAALTMGTGGSILGGPLGGLFGSAIGSIVGSYAVDDLFSETTGYNPDVSGWDQFINSMTFGALGQSGDEQMQAEFDAFSGMDNMFDDDDGSDPTPAEQAAIDAGTGKWGGPSEALLAAIEQARIDEETGGPEDPTVPGAKGPDHYGIGTGGEFDGAGMDEADTDSGTTGQGSGAEEDVDSVMGDDW